jgi:hypothetical protein
MDYDQLIKIARDNFPSKERLAMDAKMFELRLIDIETYSFALVAKEFFLFLKSLKDKTIESEIKEKLKEIDRQWEELARPVKEQLDAGEDFASLVITSEFDIENYKKVCNCQAWTEFLIQTLNLLKREEVEYYPGIHPIPNNLN